MFSVGLGYFKFKFNWGEFLLWSEDQCSYKLYKRDSLKEQNLWGQSVCHDSQTASLFCIPCPSFVVCTHVKITVRNTLLCFEGKLQSCFIHESFIIFSYPIILSSVILNGGVFFLFFIFFISPHFNGENVTRNIHNTSPPLLPSPLFLLSLPFLPCSCKVLLSFMSIN